MTSEVRKIVSIDQEKCDGCGLCIPSCAEGALQIVDGKARLTSDRFCDGLGNCLGECPRGAIEIIEREAEIFDQAAVEEHLESFKATVKPGAGCGACAGSAEREIRVEKKCVADPVPQVDREAAAAPPEAELSHWPIQLHLVSPRARFLQGRDLLIAADCVPFATPEFHQELLKGKSLLIFCPKLDDLSAYLEKLTAIFKTNSIPRVTLAHMEVPCCFGLKRLVLSALEKAGETVELDEVIVGVDGSFQSGGSGAAAG